MEKKRRRRKGFPWPWKMNKLYIILYVFILLVLCSFVSAVEYSTNPEDYYFDNLLGYYLVDGINSSDIGLNGTQAVNGQSLSTTGWTSTATTREYSTTQVAIGSLSAKLNAGQAYIQLEDNTNFLGSFGIQMYDDGGEMNFATVFQNADVTLTIDGGIRSTPNYVWDVSTDTDCDNNTIARSVGWHSFTYNYTSASTIDMFVDGILCHQFSSFVGFSLMFINEGGGTDSYFDDFWVANGDRPLGEGAGLTGNFSVTAKSSSNGSSITYFSIWINETFLNTSTGSIITNISINSTFLYNITVMSIGYYNRTYLDYNVSSNLVALLDPFNSVSITIRDEETSNLIYDNVSIKFQNNQSEITYYTNTSALLVGNLDSGQYNIVFDVLDTSLNYSQKSYILTISNSSTLRLNAYLTQNPSTTTLIISDKSTSGLLPDVGAISYRMINNTWVVIQSGLTDIIGQISFLYIPNTRYKFYLSKSDYADYIFYLNPITSPTYSIDMTRTAQINESQDYDQIALVYAPFLFYEGQDNNFTFLISSPYGELISYGYDLTFPGGTASNSDSNSLGSQLYNNFTIAGASIYDTVKVDYYYESSFAGRRSFTSYYPIVVEESKGNNTMIANRDKTYGLGIFERIFFAVFIVILVVGIATLIGQPIPGMGMGLLIYGYFVYIGMVPLWSVLISFMLGLVIIGSRPGG